MAMKRFYLATVSEYENRVIEELGALGCVHLITDYSITGFKRVDTVEKCKKFTELQDRMKSIISTLPPQKQAKKTITQLLQETIRKPSIAPQISPKISLEQIESGVSEIEQRLDGLLEKLEKARTQLRDLTSVRENLLILQKHGLHADALGDFENLWVRAGFMNREFSSKLGSYIEGTSVKYATWPDRQKEDFVVIYGANQDKAAVEDTLKRLNFIAVVLPIGIIPEPTRALEENEHSLSRVKQEIDELEVQVRGICEGFQQRASEFEPMVRFALGIEDARSTFSRTETLSLVSGWVPEENAEHLKRTLTDSTNGTLFLRFDDPDLNDQPPALLRNRSLAKHFELLTRLRGTPQYREVDPTPIVTILFTVMYGMMFGDIGQGILLFLMGFTFNRLNRSFLGIPGGAMKRLGGILAACGASATFFGVMYGEFFLSDAFHPIFVNPIQSQTEMIVVALLFGVGQLFLGIILKIVNLLRSRARFEAAVGGIRFVYYSAGVALAVKYASSLSLEVFVQNLWLTVVAVVALILVALSPLIESLIHRKLELGESMMKGVSEFIETFLSYLTNSISYVRLAAFAIAHSALGIAVVILAANIGLVPSLLLMNLLAMTIEVLGVFIQCMRLIYYEFFTKFYSGEGVTYRPFVLPLLRNY